MSKKTLLGGAVVIGLLFAACSPDDETTVGSATPSSAGTTSSATGYTPGSTSPSPVADPVPVAAPAFAGEPVVVTEIIDGDTFKISDGREIRVLGIDSCETGTYGGDQATTAARGQLTNSYNTPVTMTSQPGVDRDRYGRHLRYVQLGSNHLDFGEFMVKYDHTGVYQGRNDAAPDYVGRLYSVDTAYAANPPSGRECGDPYPPAPTSSDDSYSYDGNDYNMPDGALTGGYCARKWWC